MGSDKSAAPGSWLVQRWSIKIKHTQYTKSTHSGRLSHTLGRRKSPTFVCNIAATIRCLGFSFGCCAWVGVFMLLDTCWRHSSCITDGKYMAYFRQFPSSYIDCRLNILLFMSGSEVDCIKPLSDWHVYRLYNMNISQLYHLKVIQSIHILVAAPMYVYNLIKLSHSSTAVCTSLYETSLRAHLLRQRCTHTQTQTYTNKLTHTKIWYFRTH